MKAKKKIIPIIALIVLAISIIGIAFQPNFIQVGDSLISDTYYDTAYEAYKYSDDAVNIEEEITTVDINSKFAVWLAESDEDELVLIKMAVNNGKYFSLGNVSIRSEKTLNNIANNISSSLESEFTLGDEMLKYETLPKEKYDRSSLANKNYNTEYFVFNGSDYVFVYNVVSD